MYSDSRLVERDYVLLHQEARESMDMTLSKRLSRRCYCGGMRKASYRRNHTLYYGQGQSYVALKDIHMWYRTQLNIPVIGITGSVGKTSTKELV